MLEKQAEDFRKMRSGDMKAFERLFVSLYPGLCNIANHYLNNEMLSKDVAQDAFIKWWNKREDFRDFAAVKSFLYITIRNQCLNYIRDHRKEVDLAGRFSEETDADFDLMVIEEEAIEALYSGKNRNNLELCPTVVARCGGCCSEDFCCQWECRLLPV